MAAKQMHYTKEGYQALVDELEYLKTTRRAEVKEALAVARSYGDLSENSEYDEARNEQAKVESRISELESLIIHAIVVDESEIDHSKVSVGSIVKVRSADGKETEYTLVGTNEVDFWTGKISDQSPVGAALIGAREGDTVKVTVGSVIHPMTEEHLIEWVYLMTDKGGQRKCLSAGDAPTVEFKLVGEKPIAVYAYCNLHGLWVKEI